MGSQGKQLSNPFSTGGGGGHFEAHIQSSFIALMLTGGCAPCLPRWPIKEVKLQGKIDGYDTDDLIVFVENSHNGEVRKLLGQVKHAISITKGSSVLGEVIQSAWYDFNNSSVFTRNKDVIALITGPISAVDQLNVQWLLHHARHTKDSVEFFRDVKKSNFSPSKAVEKLGVFSHHLKVANGGKDVSEEEIYLFFNHFHFLGYDLGGETGVALSLLHSHISQFQHQYPEWVWGRIVDVVQTWNQHAGTVTRNKIPEDLLNIFKQKKMVVAMPEEFKSKKASVEMLWSDHPERAKLALIVLLGSWNENNEHDVSVLSQLLNMSYDIWLSKARDILHQPDSPLKLKNGIWTVIGGEALLNHLGSQILDQDIDQFRIVAENVLQELDPALDLPKDQRYAASIHGKVLKHSDTLRHGISEGLALLGSRPQLFTNCSLSKVESTVVLIVRIVFENSKWQLWASLNRLLPNLAEADPNEFLNQIDSALYGELCPFDNVFAQEGNGSTGGNYLTGLLWALESLAWDDRYIVRVCCILAELAERDPGGSWMNRPVNSIIAILLPWLPQTLANADKRKVAMKAIVDDTPEVGWKVVLQLLPGQHQTSSGTHKPKWRRILLDEEGKGVSQKEYWEQATFFAELAVNMSSSNFERISELVDHLGHLPKPAFDKFIINLSSNQLMELPEENKYVIWDRLTKFTAKHRRFSDAEWALSNDLLVRIEQVSESISPKDPFNLYQNLFSNLGFEFYEENGNWEERRNNLAERRKIAVDELLSLKGLDGVIEFAKVVQSPREVGQALGAIADGPIDHELLPNLLTTDNTKMKDFIAAFLWCRHFINGWKWVDQLLTSAWTKEELGQLLAYLPFDKNAWDRARLWLLDDEIEYWKRTPANAYQVDDLDEAIEKLIKYGRPRAAIDCLGGRLFNKKPLNSAQCIRVLLAGVSSGESDILNEQYNIIELIKYLQSDQSVDKNGLFMVEWAYLPLLEGHHEVAPTLLENRLSTDPDFFCELIKLIYRSEKESPSTKELSEEKKAVALNAWKLINYWKTPPGTLSNGSFNSKLFNEWLTRVKGVCKESGHLDVAMISVGGVLVHAIADDDGLWIHRTIAAALNRKDAESLRKGFRTATYNSRGVHFVDPSGKQERKLANNYLQKADVVENEGFHRFAITLRDIAEEYNREAEIVVFDFGKDDVDTN